MKEIEELMKRNGFECLNHDKSHMYWKADLDVSLDVERYCYDQTIEQIKNFDEKDYEDLKWFSMKRMLPQMEIGISTEDEMIRNKCFPYLEMVPDILIKGFSLRCIVSKDRKSFESRYNYNFTMKRKFLEGKNEKDYRKFSNEIDKKMDEKNRLKSIFDVEFIPRLVKSEAQSVIEKSLLQMEQEDVLSVLESELSDFMREKLKMLVDEYIVGRIQDERSDGSE